MLIFAVQEFSLIQLLPYDRRLGCGLLEWSVSGSHSFPNAFSIRKPTLNGCHCNHQPSKTPFPWKKPAPTKQKVDKTFCASMRTHMQLPHRGPHQPCTASRRNIGRYKADSFKRENINIWFAWGSPRKLSMEVIEGVTHPLGQSMYIVFIFKH